MHPLSLTLLAWLLTCPAALICGGTLLILPATPNTPYAVAANDELYVMSCLQHICAPLPEGLS